jgi:hypothetical protein
LFDQRETLGGGCALEIILTLFVLLLLLLMLLLCLVLALVQVWVAGIVTTGEWNSGVAGVVTLKCCCFEGGTGEERGRRGAVAVAVAVAVGIEYALFLAM